MGLDPGGVPRGITAKVAGTPDHNRGIARKIRSFVISSPVKTFISGLETTN